MWQFLPTFRLIIRPQFFVPEYETGKSGEQGHRAENDGQSRPGLIPGDSHGHKEIQRTQPLQRTEYQHQLKHSRNP